MAKIYDNVIDKNVEWSGDESTGGLPVSGRRVQEFIKGELSRRIGVLWYDAQRNMQLAFADESDRDKYIENPEEYADLILASFDAPANYTAEIALLSPNVVTVKQGATGTYVEFTFDVKNKSGASAGDSVECTYTFVSADRKVEVREVYAAGQAVKFLVDEYLSAGSTTVNIRIKGLTTMATTMVGMTFNVIDLVLSSDFDFAAVKEANTTIEIPYVVRGTGVKYVEFYVDGEKYGDDDTVTDAAGTRTKYIELGNIASGRHHLQVRAYVVIGGQKHYSSVLYRDFAVSGDGVVLMVAADVPTLVSSQLALVGRQYEDVAIQMAMFDSRHRVLDVAVDVDGVRLSTISASNGTAYNLYYSPNVSGEQVLTLSCGDIVYSVPLTIEASDISIEEPMEGLVMKLSAQGRSNDDLNRAVWTDRGYTATLKSFDYTENQGWNGDALVVSGGATVEVDIAPMEKNWATGGGTIIFDIETSNIDNAEAILCECMDDDTLAGFRITPNEAYIQSAGGARVKTNYKERERMQLAFIVNKSSGTENAKLVFIVNNGKNERAVNYAITDTFANSKKMVLGDPNGNVTLKLYSIAVYNRALTVDEAFNAWALTVSNRQAVVQRNDIYAAGTDVISPDKVVSRVPVLLITGNMPVLIAANDKKTNIHADVEYRNNQDPTKNFTAKQMKMYRQGTSSLSYKIPNLNIEIDDQTIMYDNEDRPIEAYAFKDKAQPVRLWCLKADVAESSGSHNVGIARLMHNVMYNTKVDDVYLQDGEDAYVLRTKAQRAAIEAGYPYDVRTTIDGFPIVVFYRLNDTSEWVCMGQYNFNNDKKTESVFGFEGIPGFDNSHVECWEGLNNTEAVGLYTDVSNFDEKWSEAFESRYPDGSTNVDNLKAFAMWVNSTKNNVEKFYAEKYEHLDVWKVAAYYVYVMRFGAVDQMVKNTMTTTEDGIHYFFIYYDNDTINGKRNDGPLVYGPFIDRETIDEELNTYAYAGHESVLWNNLEADTDFMEKVAIIDNAMYSAGLSYDGVLMEFDTNQVDKWNERLGNINGEYKYLKAFKEEGNSQYLPMLQGDLKSHRHWWLSNRFELFDSMWVSGSYKAKAIVLKTTANKGDGFTVVAGKSLRYGYGINNDPVQYGVSLNIGEEHRFTVERDGLQIGDPVRIYAANSIRELHLEELAATLVEVNVDDAYDEVLGSKMKGIYIGNSEVQNTAVDGIGGLASMVELEELDIVGMKGIKSLELSALRNLHRLDAKNSGLTSFIPAVGAKLNYVALPSGLQSIWLDKVTIEDFQYTPDESLREVVAKNVTWSNLKTFILNWHTSLYNAGRLSVASLTLEGINWKHIDAVNTAKLADFGFHSIKGMVTLNSITQEEVDILSEAFGTSVFIPDGEFYIKAPDGLFIGGKNNVKGGEKIELSAAIFSENPGNVEWSIISGTGVTIENVSEGNGMFCTIATDEDVTDRTIVVRATHTPTSGAVTTATKEIMLSKVIRVSEGVVEGMDVLGGVGVYKFIPSPNDYTEQYTIEWSLAGEAADAGYVSILSQDGDTCQVQVLQMVSGSTFEVMATVNNGEKTFYISKAIRLDITVTIKIEGLSEDDIDKARVTITYGETTIEAKNGDIISIPTGVAVTMTPQNVPGYESLSSSITTIIGNNSEVFTFEYASLPGTWIVIDQSISDPATMISGDVNGEHIQLIRNGSHRYLGMFDTDEEQMYVTQLKDSNSNHFKDYTPSGSVSAPAPYLTGNGGDVFMRMPNFFYRCIDYGGDVWGIGFYCGETAPGNGWNEWKKNTLIGVYEAYREESKIYSRSGVTSSNNISQANFKAYARNCGNGFQIVDWQMHCVMAILFYAQYGHTNSQEKIGAGTGSIKVCGQTNANGMNDTKGTSPVSGLNDAGADGNAQSINFWGLENWWGNKSEWIDNVVVDVDANEWKITEPDGTVRNPWKSLVSSGYISKMIFEDNCDLIPTGASGSSTTGFCDFFTVASNASNTYVTYRSFITAQNTGGVSFVEAIKTSSDTSQYIGSRLAFRGSISELTNSEYIGKYPDSYYTEGGNTPL